MFHNLQPNLLLMHTYIHVWVETWSNSQSLGSITITSAPTSSPQSWANLRSTLSRGPRRRLDENANPSGLREILFVPHRRRSQGHVLSRARLRRAQKERNEKQFLDFFLSLTRVQWRSHSSAFHFAGICNKVDFYVSPSGECDGGRRRDRDSNKLSGHSSLFTCSANCFLCHRISSI